MPFRIQFLLDAALLSVLLAGCSAPHLPGQAAGVPTPTPPKLATISTATPLPQATSTQLAPPLGTRQKTTGCTINGPLPDAACTPGAVFLEATRAAICVSGYSGSVRNVPTSLKDQVYASYGIASHAPGQYEVDHLISLELGGSNDVANLWPESAEPRPGFHEKDAVENYLHAQVCSGAIALQDAQRVIASNWLPIYQQLQGGAPGGVVLLPPGAAATALPAPTAAAGHSGVPPNGFDCPAAAPIKGNIRSDGTLLYHLPNTASYKQTHPEQCFATSADAEAAGFRPAR